MREYGEVFQVTLLVMIGTRFSAPWLGPSPFTRTSKPPLLSLITLSLTHSLFPRARAFSAGEIRMQGFFFMLMCSVSSEVSGWIWADIWGFSLFFFLVLIGRGERAHCWFRRRLCLLILREVGIFVSGLLFTGWNCIMFVVYSLVEMFLLICLFFVLLLGNGGNLSSFFFLSFFMRNCCFFGVFILVSMHALYDSQLLFINSWICSSPREANCWKDLLIATISEGFSLTALILLCGSYIMTWNLLVHVKHCL